MGLSYVHMYPSPGSVSPNQIRTVDDCSVPQVLSDDALGSVAANFVACRDLVVSRSKKGAHGLATCVLRGTECAP